MHDNPHKHVNEALRSFFPNLRLIKVFSHFVLNSDKSYSFFERLSRYNQLGKQKDALPDHKAAYRCCGGF